MRSDRRRIAYLPIGVAALIAVHASTAAQNAPAPPAQAPPKRAEAPKPAPPKPKPAPKPQPPPRRPPQSEDDAIVRDLELYMLFEMLNDYELFYDDDETRQTTPKTR